jgi:hypothetical protein
VVKKKSASDPKPSNGSEATNKTTGEPCQAPPRIGHRFCYQHDPTIAKKRTAERSAGGSKNRRVLKCLPDFPAVQFDTLAQVKAFLAAMATRVLRGELDVRLGNCLAVYASTALRPVMPDETMRQIEMLQGQVKELKELLHARNGKNGQVHQPGSVVDATRDRAAPAAGTPTERRSPDNGGGDRHPPILPGPLAGRGPALFGSDDDDVL